MTKKDKNTIGSIIAVLTFIASFIYREIFTTYIEIYIYLLILIVLSAFVSEMVKYMIPNKKKRNINKSIKEKNATVSKKVISDKDILTYDIELLKGENFENLLYLYFKDKGYKPKKTAVTGDHGVDLLIKDPKDGLDIAVQCKGYKAGNNIGNKLLRELEGAKRCYKCPGAMFITTSNNYTQKAKEYADMVHIDIWNGLIVHHRLEKWRKGKLNKIS